MYKVLDGITSPKDKNTLWRYMSFEKFVDILNTESLFYTRAYKFEDTFEGVIPRPIMDAYQKALSHHAPEEHRPGVMKIIKIWRKHVMCNCWHQNREESKEMWDNYGANNDSVAIKTTMGKIKNSLSGTDFDAFIGKIKYLSQRTYEENYTHNFLEGIENGLELYKKWTYFPYFYKRKQFEYEREVRIIIDIDPFIEDVLRNQPAEAILDTEFLECEFPDLDENGKLFKVDVNTLINEVITSPYADDRIIQNVKSVVQEYGFNFEVNCSTLLDNPSSIETSTVEEGEKLGESTRTQ